MEESWFFMQKSGEPPIHVKSYNTIIWHYLEICAILCCNDYEKDLILSTESSEKTQCQTAVARATKQ